MEVKQINQLMLAMGRTGIKRLVLKKEGIELELERQDLAPLKGYDGGDLTGIEENPMRTEIERHRQSAAVITTHEERASPKALVDEKEESVSLYVSSPMVGTVYFAPSPNDPPFVKPGDRVEKNTVVCIIEAMKVMNEVKAGVSGTIQSPLVENGHPVEFGTKLYRIIPS